LSVAPIPAPSSRYQPPPRLAEVVGGEHDLRPGRRDRTDERLHGGRCAGVERRRGLVEEEHLGVERPRPGERHALLLADGEAPRRLVRAGGEAGRLERLGHPRPPRPARNAAEAERPATFAATERRRSTGRWNTIA
jgi:hypothetical protein